MRGLAHSQGKLTFLKWISFLFQCVEVVTGSWLWFTTSHLLHSERVPIFMIDAIVWGSEDSLYCTPSSREREAELIRSFIRCEWAVTRGTVDTRAPEFSDKSMPVFYPKVPQQENGYDCGVFLLMFFEQFLKRKLPVDDLRWYNQSSALPFRKRIAVGQLVSMFVSKMLHTS
ncbi:uncharacterized protein [Montipora capricornis]